MLYPVMYDCSNGSKFSLFYHMCSILFYFFIHIQLLFIFSRILFILSLISFLFSLTSFKLRPNFINIQSNLICLKSHHITFSSIHGLLGTELVMFHFIYIQSHLICVKSILLIFSLNLTIFSHLSYTQSSYLYQVPSYLQSHLLTHCLSTPAESTPDSSQLKIWSVNSLHNEKFFPFPTLLTLL